MITVRSCGSSFVSSGSGQSISIDRQINGSRLLINMRLYGGDNSNELAAERSSINWLKAHSKFMNNPRKYVTHKRWRRSLDDLTSFIYSPAFQSALERRASYARCRAQDCTRHMSAAVHCQHIIRVSLSLSLSLSLFLSPLTMVNQLLKNGCYITTLHGKQRRLLSTAGPVYWFRARSERL